MSKITTDFNGTESLLTTKTRLGQILTFWKGSSALNEVSTWGDVRSVFNSIAPSLVSISDNEVASSFLPKLNTLNNPDLVISNSIFGNGELGAWFDPSDIATLFQSRAGINPVTAAGQSVGVVLDKSQGLVVGPDVKSQGVVGIVGTATPATYDTVTGQGSVSRGANVANQSFVTWTALTPRLFYRISITCQTGAIFLRLGNQGAVLGFEMVAGQTSEVLLPASSLGQLTVTSGLVAGSSTFTISSFNLLSGNHAAANVDAQRPSYRTTAGPQKNLARGSSAVDNTAFWPASVTQNGITVTKTIVTRPDGLPAVHIRYQGTATAGFVNLAYSNAFSRTPGTTGEVFTGSAIAKLVGGSTAGVQRLAANILERGVSPSFSILGSSEVGITNETSDTTMVVTRTVSNASTAFVDFTTVLVVTVGAAIDVTYEIAALQFERGSARTAYEFNYADNRDVITTTAPHLLDDLADDAVFWNAPAGTYTVAWVDTLGNVTIQTAQALSGQVDMLRAQRTAGYIAVNRPLSTSETAQLTAYLQRKVGL